MTGTKNKLSNLHNTLFEQLERLNNDELTVEELDNEIKRSRAMTDIASRIIENGNLVLRAKRAADDNFDADFKLPKMLTEE